MVRFEHSFTVSGADIDRQAHANNVAYVRWIQEVAVAHWQAAASETRQAELTWVVVRHEIDYLKPAFENEQITAETFVGKATAATCERFTEIRRKDVLLAKARSVWCLLDRQTLKPRRIDGEMKELFGMN